MDKAGRPRDLRLHDLNITKNNPSKLLLSNVVSVLSNFRYLYFILYNKYIANVENEI